MKTSILIICLLLIGFSAYAQNATLTIDNGDNPDSYNVYADGEYLGENITSLPLPSGRSFITITTVRLHGELPVLEEELILTAGENRTIRLVYPELTAEEIREFNELETYLDRYFDNTNSDRETERKLSGILSRLSGLTSPLYIEKKNLYREYFNRLLERKQEPYRTWRNGVGLSLNFLISDSPRDDNGYSSAVDSTFADRFGIQFELTYLRPLRAVDPFYIALTLQYSMNNWIYWQDETSTEPAGYQQDYYHGAAILFGIGIHPEITQVLSFVLETGLGNQSYFYDSRNGEFSGNSGAIMSLEVYIKGGPAFLIGDFLRTEILFFYDFNSNAIEVSRGGLGFRFLLCY